MAPRAIKFIPLLYLDRDGVMRANIMNIMS